MAPLPSFSLQEEYDLIIIGAGPAGISGAINAARHKASFLLLDQAAPMEKIRVYGQVANYPGLGIVKGEELARRFLDHLLAFQIAPQRERVMKIAREADAYQIYGHEKVYRARAVLLAPGIVYEKKIPGEEALLGKRVSYCLSCDGLLYAGKRVGVIAEDPEGESEAVSLQQNYGSQVIFYATYLSVATSSFHEVYPNARVQRLEKTDRGVTIIAEKQTDREVNGVFIFRKGTSPASLSPSLDMDKQHVRVGRNMQTNLPGIFCAGDSTGTPYQIGKAVGEGQVAALAAIKYLAALK
ncbi:MAG: NAD(P)/FAD-dependent oxidoreductase [bacterium]